MLMFLLLVLDCTCGDPAETTATPPPPTPIGAHPSLPRPQAGRSVVPDGCHPELASSTAGSTWTASDLNTAGYRCYKADRIADAATLFRAAIAIDPNYALAHYNLACTLSLLRQKGDKCGQDATLRTILDHLATAIRLDPSRKARMREDPDLSEIRNTLAYRLLEGADLSDPSTLGNILPGTTFWGTSTGAYGSTEILDFQVGGRALLRQRTFSQDGVPNGWATTEGRWTLDGTSIRLTLGVLSGQYVFEGTSTLTDGKTRWWVLPDECSA